MNSKLIPDQAKQQACFLQVGFQLYYFTRADIERWAKEWVMVLEKPPTELIELTVTQEKTKGEVVDSLISIAGVTIDTDIMIGFIGKLFCLGRITVLCAMDKVYWLPEPNKDIDLLRSQVLDCIIDDEMRITGRTFEDVADEVEADMDIQAELMGLIGEFVTQLDEESLDLFGVDVSDLVEVILDRSASHFLNFSSNETRNLFPMERTEL